MLENGKMFVGCNYWASHAGAAMWHDWQPKIVEQDFKQLKDVGCELVRVFPIWSEFQPLQKLSSINNKAYELRMGEELLPDTEAGQAGVDETMIERFKFLADTALKYDLKLSVGLITGWMSGRIFAPPAFQSDNLITNQLCVKWQVKFVRYFVKTFKDHPAIVMWGPGNESNCLSEATREEFYQWCSTISMAIRLEDDTKTIAAGMHGLLPASNSELDGAQCSIQEQGEIWDALTVHPYPEFTAYARNEPIHFIRNLFHAVSESRMYTDIGKKPAFAEEIGTLTEVWGGDKTKAAYTRSVMFNIWSHNCGGFLWWNAYDQDKLTNAPYAWIAWERELGLFDSDKKAKPFTSQLKEVKTIINDLPFEALPEFKKDACCILSKKQDVWANAWGSFVLAKQAGFDIQFAYSNDPLPDSECYIVPGVSSDFAFQLQYWNDLLEKVEAGADLYISMNEDGNVVPFEKLFGVSVQYKHQISEEINIKFGDKQLPLKSLFQRIMTPTSAKVLASDENNNPIFFENNYGKGRVYLLDAPMEESLIKDAMRLTDTANSPYYKLYQAFTGKLLEQRIIQIDDPSITTTEHYFNKSEAVVVFMNTTQSPKKVDYKINKNWHLSELLYGSPAKIKANDVLIVKLVENK